MEKNYKKLRIFPPSIHYFTPSGEINFQGAVKEVFEEINSNHDVSEKIKGDYFVAYINRIFPLFNSSIPISDYDDILINKKIDELKTKRILITSTIKGNYKHLIIDPIVYYRKKHCDEYAGINTWGSIFKFNRDGFENIDSAIALIPKSFSEENDEKLRKFFLLCEDDDGEIFGLAIMYFIGARENEICGLTFADVIQMESHPDCHYIISGYSTTKENSNEKKAGSKTKNGSKRTPIEQEVYDLITRRMAKIEKETNKTCLDLPIACRGKNYDVGCSTNNLSDAGRKFFRDFLHIRENDLAGLAVEIANMENNPFKEDEPTTYLFRRNFATRMGNLRTKDGNGLSLADLQYLQSHNIDNPNINRWDYNDDEILYKLYLKMYGGKNT